MLPTLRMLPIIKGTRVAESGYHSFIVSRLHKIYIIRTQKVDESGTKDQVELYSGMSVVMYLLVSSLNTMTLVNMDVTRREHPVVLRQYMSEIDAFAQHCHFNILHPILR